MTVQSLILSQLTHWIHEQQLERETLSEPQNNTLEAHSHSTEVMLLCLFHYVMMFPQRKALISRHLTPNLTNNILISDLPSDSPTVPNHFQLS